MDAKDDSHYVKRVVLPSGKTIEVVYFKDTAEPEAGFRTVAEPEQELHACPACESQLVYPTAWEEVADQQWHVELRCPECEYHRNGTFSQTTVEAFDSELDRATDALSADLRRLCRANMVEEIERFATAIHCDAVLPEDF